MGLAPELRAPVCRLFGDLPDAVRLIFRDGETIACNEAARLLPEEGLGHLCPEGKSSEDASCPACQRSLVFDRGMFLRWHVVTGAASDRDYYEVTLCPVHDAEGGVEAVLEVIRDATATLGVEQYLIGRVEQQDVAIRSHSSKITRLKSSQAGVMSQDRLAGLSLLVAGVSHEVHTPLGAMISSADLMRRSIDRLEQDVLPQVDESRREAFEGRLATMRESTKLMVEGAKGIQSVISNLRQFSRLDEADRQPADLNAGLSTTIGLLRYQLGSKIVIERDYDEELPDVVCRPNALNQVFLNLLLNAVQAIAGRGTIRVSTRRDGDDHVIIEIADDGSGISESAMRHIFDLGFTTRANGGTGIGLALSRRVVEEHAGTISARSREGEGATFTVRLPINGTPGSADRDDDDEDGLDEEST